MGLRSASHAAIAEDADQRADYPVLTQFLDYELKADVLNELDRQILLGDGTGEELRLLRYGPRSLCYIDVMSAMLAPASLRVTATGPARISAAVEAVRAMPIEQIRAELKRRREQTAVDRETGQLERIEDDARRTVTRIARSAA